MEKKRKKQLKNVEYLKFDSFNISDRYITYTWHHSLYDFFYCLCMTSTN